MFTPSLTPVKSPTLGSTKAVSGEQNVNGVCVAHNLRPPVIVRVLRSIKECRAIFIGDSDGVISSAIVNVKVSEADPDGVALSNVDSSILVEVVDVLLGKLGDVRTPVVAHSLSEYGEEP